jgi:F-type H+-transporting ATPase subunit epsilon
MFPEEIELIVVTPERQLLQEPVVEVTIPGLDGALGVLPGHAPLMTELGNGELSYRQGTTSQPVSLAVLRGFAEVLGNRVTVLAETAERAEEIDLARAETAKARAEKRLASTDSNIDWDRATVALERAVIRIQVAKKYRGLPVEIPHPA